MTVRGPVTITGAKVSFVIAFGTSPNRPIAGETFHVIQSGLVLGTRSIPSYFIYTNKYFFLVIIHNTKLD